MYKLIVLYLLDGILFSNEIEEIIVICNMYKFYKFKCFYMLFFFLGIKEFLVNKISKDINY